MTNSIYFNATKSLNHYLCFIVVAFSNFLVSGSICMPKKYQGP